MLQWGRPGFNPRVGKMPWRTKWLSSPYSDLENSRDRGTWQATVHGLQRVGQDWVIFTFTFIQVFSQQKWFRIQTWWFVIHYYFYHCIALHTSFPVQVVLTIIMTIKTNIYQALIIFQEICYIICTYFLI